MNSRPFAAPSVYFRFLYFEFCVDGPLRKREGMCCLFKKISRNVCCEENNKNQHLNFISHDLETSRGLPHHFQALKFV